MWRITHLFDHITIRSHLYTKETLIGRRIMACTHTYGPTKEYTHLVKSNVWIQPWVPFFDMFNTAQTSFVMKNNWNSVKSYIYHMFCWTYYMFLVLLSIHNTYMLWLKGLKTKVLLKWHHNSHHYLTRTLLGK